MTETEKGVEANDVKEFLKVMNELSLRNINNKTDVGYKVGFQAWRGLVEKELTNNKDNKDNLSSEQLKERLKKYNIISVAMQEKAGNSGLMTTVADKEGNLKDIKARSYRIAQAAVADNEVMELFDQPDAVKHKGRSG